MKNALRVTLIGIILILASLFFMGVCITSRPTSSGPEGLTLFLFVAGLIVSVIGLFFIKGD
ncbi:MAG: hypothetical protein HFF70_00430 [Oscillospiraceae bacterium]|jgi:hypothetical protein|nr:hypothetical protein [Oscillospiraceae bacterium]